MYLGKDPIELFGQSSGFHLVYLVVRVQQLRCDHNAKRSRRKVII